MCQLCIGFDWLIFLLTVGHIFLLLCILGNLRLNARHKNFIWRERKQILLHSYKYWAVFGCGQSIWKLIISSLAFKDSWDKTRAIFNLCVIMCHHDATSFWVCYLLMSHGLWHFLVCLRPALFSVLCECQVLIPAII